MIIVDNREKSFKTTYLEKSGKKFELEMLNYGDYMVIGETERYIFENKSLPDFFASAKDNRIWQQLKGLEKFEGFHKFLAIEGAYPYAFLKKTVYGWDTPNTKRYNGILESIIRNWHDVSILSFESWEAFLDFIIWLDSRIEQPKADKVFVNPIKKAQREISQEQLDLLASMAGIGGAKAKSLLETFGSLKKIVNAPIRKLKTVLNEPVAKHVHDVFTEEWSE